VHGGDLLLFSGGSAKYLSGRGGALNLTSGAGLAGSGAVRFASGAAASVGGSGDVQVVSGDALGSKAGAVRVGSGAGQTAGSVTVAVGRAVAALTRWC
jgi:hypothetical protein